MQQNSFYVFASSESQVFSDNTYSHFRVKLDREYNFDSKWSVAIINKSIKINQRHFITSNICSYSIVFGRKIQLAGTFLGDNIPNIIYIPLAKIDTDVLEFYILNSKLREIKRQTKLPKSELFLHFKKNLIGN